MPSLAILFSAVLVLSCRQTDRQTESQRRINAMLTRLPSARVRREGGVGAGMRVINRLHSGRKPSRYGQPRSPFIQMLMTRLWCNTSRASLLTSYVSKVAEIASRTDVPWTELAGDVTWYMNNIDISYSFVLPLTRHSMTSSLTAYVRPSVSRLSWQKALCWPKTNALSNTSQGIGRSRAS